MGEAMAHLLRLGILAGLFSIFALTSALAAQNETTVRRAAFDVGSAAIKCTVADVDTADGTIAKVIETLSIKVDFAEDMARSYDGNFSREVLAKGMDALRELKTKALDLGAKEFSAVGGSAFREARNGRAFFATVKDELGIRARVISKQQTSLLSYHSVRLNKDISAMNLLVWDVGGGSQQMTTRNLDGGLTFYIDNMAAVPFKNVVINIIQEKDLNTVKSPNPISLEQAARALEYAATYASMNVPPPLAKRIKGGAMQVIGIGGVHYYAIPELIGKAQPTYTRAQVEDALNRWVGKTDEEFKSEYADSRLTNLILVLGYMKALDIDEVSPLKANQTEGLLVAPEFW